MNKVQDARSLPASPLSHLPGMVFRCTVDLQRTMLYVSEGVRQVTGYEPEELLQSAAIAYGDLIYQRDQEMVAQTIASALREERSFQMSYRIHTRLGEEKWVWEQGNAIVADEGGVQAVESIVVDITPRRMAAPPAEEQRESGGQRAAGIAHDFKNIMSIIVLYSELLERQPEHPRRHHYLSVITKQALHASGLIGQLLNYSRTLSPETELVELNEFLEEVATLLEQTLAEKIALRVASDISEAVVAADSTRLQQVILNLVLNAQDAMPDGGQLELLLSELVLSGEEKLPAAFSRRAWSDLADERWVKVEVRDSGMGIPPEVLPHIFQPFFTTKKGGGGTGLGLVQVDGIVEQLGGVIGVDSAEGKGTTFTVYLPLVAAEEAAARGMRPGSQPFGTPEEHILVVEDDVLTREVMVDAVRSLGYQARAAASGHEALQILESEPVDLLFAAGQIGEMRGEELCWRARRRCTNLPCVLVAGSGKEAGSGRRQDQIYRIHKPLSLQTMARSLRLALAN